VVAALAFCFLFLRVAEGQSAPPKGVTWKNTLADGKKEAATRKMPILMFVGGGANGATLAKNLEDPKIVEFLKYFVCVFVSRDYNLSNFQSSYVPWIGATPQTRFSPPCLIFGDKDGNAQQQFRLEGKAPSVNELIKHFEKVMQVLTPENSQKAKLKKLVKATAAEAVEFLAEPLEGIGEKLEEGDRDGVKEELKWAGTVLGYVEKKFKKIKDSKDRKKAAGLVKAMKRQFTLLKRSRGTDTERPLKDLAKAKEILEEMREIAPE
jgi:hypothetical protein